MYSFISKEHNSFMNKYLWLFIIFLAPLLAAQMIQNLSPWQTLMHVLLSAALVVLLGHTQHLGKRLNSIFKFLLITFYLTFLFMLLFEVILFDFTGKGFTSEVYFHFETQSLLIGINEYPLQPVAFVFLVFLYAFGINKLLKTFSQTKHILFSSIIAIVLLFTATIHSSLARFSGGFIDYFWQEPIELNEDLINQYVDLGVIQNGVITTKNELNAETNINSKNLILVYLESFNEGLLDLKNYPELTPKINELSQRYNKFKHLSSSYVTIEGIISSQCGTMLPMTAGNNTFLNEGQLLYKMPCMGDVLKEAGYTQFFLGGAQMDFAGKGRFLETHGYDHIWGLEHWKANGIHQTKGIWGISDSQVFKSALDTIKQAAEKPPYNVTILTLGTHLPGYTYKECIPYSSSDEAFIKAIHCTDQLLGQFVKELEKAQLLENTVLMIVADHGIFPATKMKELLPDQVNDRRLIGITNYPSLPDQSVSSYDLAPTILDMLNIRHNTSFLFGQSLFKKSKSQQKYVTRSSDWLGEKMIPNPKGPCAENEKLSWPLNKCQKQQLLSLTGQMLAYYSIKELPEPLGCELDIRFDYDKNNKNQWSLWLNDKNHFEHFYHKGHLLKTLRKKFGNFVFILNKDSAIEKHVYLEDNEKSISYLKSMIQNTANPLLVINSKLNSHDTNSMEDRIELQIDYFKGSSKLWSKKTTSSIIKGLELCQNT